MTDNAHSCPSSGFYTIKSWDQVSEPWDKAGRRYGPDWSVDENLEPKETPGQTGAMVWSIPFNSTYVYPEMRPDLPVGKMLRSRPNLGVCMSGGGMRAATCALGWYRGLNHLNLLQKVRYVSANSGATWTSLPLTCRSLLQKKELGTDIDLDEFVGKYGGKYDEHTVLRERSIIGDNLVNANILDPEFVSKTPGFSAWSTAINKNFVDPLMDIRQGWNWENDFWLDLSNVYLWNTDATKHILEKSLPFLILVSTGYEARNRKEFIPIENTLLYSGVPVDPRKLNEKSSFGGGFVQGVALNAESLENKEPVPSDDNILFLKEFKNPSPVVKIAQLTSAASAFVAAADAIFKIDLRDSITRKLLYRLGKFFKGKLTRINNLIDYLDPGKFKWWSPTTGGEPVELNFVDGGLFDNLGALALLRRRCSTIILCYAPTADVFDVIEPEKLHYCYFDLSALFGRGASQIPEWAAKKGYKDTFNERSQVFAGEELDSLMDEMRALRKQGKPLVVRKLLQVIPNHLAGIYESYEVDMIFCFSGVVEEFCKSETEEKTNLLSKIFGKKKKGDNFPYIDTLKCDYSMQLVSKLSSLNSYNLVEGLKNVGFDIEQVR